MKEENFSKKIRPAILAGREKTILLFAVEGLHTLFVVQDGLAHPQALGGDLQQLIICQELQALLQAHLLGGNQTQGVVGAGGTGVGQLLFLAHVHRHILAAGIDADDHAAVDGNTGADEEGAALLGVEEAVGDGLAGLKGDHGAVAPALDVALVGGIGIEHGGHDALAPGIGEEVVAVAEEATGRHQELNLHAVAHRRHFQHVRLALAQLLDDGAHAVAGHVHHQTLDGLALLAVDLLVEHAGGGDLELIALPAHGLNEDGEAHLAAAGHVEGGLLVGIGDLQRDVLEHFTVQTIPQLAGGDELALLAGKGRVVDGEGHLQSGSGDLHEGQGLHAVSGADGVADGDIGDTAHGNDVAGGRLRHSLAGKTLEFVDGSGLGLTEHSFGIVVVAHGDLLVLLEDAPLDAADGDPAHELIVVDGADQHLEGLILVGLGGGDILQNGLEQGHKVGAHTVGRVGGGAVAAGAEQHGTVQLLGRCVQVHEKLQHLVHNLVDALVGTVDLVHHHDDPVAQLQRLGEDEAGLGHGALGGVHQQNDAVDHLQNTLHLAAEVRMARGIHHVDLHVLILDGGVLGKDGDAALTLQVAGVHDALHHFLILAVYAALPQHLVHQGGLAVVDMGDDGDVSQKFILQSKGPFLI